MAWPQPAHDENALARAFSWERTVLQLPLPTEDEGSPMSFYHCTPSRHVSSRPISGVYYQFRCSVVFLWGLLFALTTLCPTLAQQDTLEWMPMFNGQDLSGWRLVNTPAETWTFEDGILRCTGKPIGEIRTEKMYQNFEMEIEWRHLVPGGNAGIFVWADDITARGVPFHRGIEVQVLENAYGNTQSHTTHGDIFPIHGADLTPNNGRGGKRAFPTEMLSKPSPEWNHYRIVCKEGNISLAVNGTLVTSGENANPSKGYICLESEGGVVEYRNGRIKELPEKPIETQRVAIADRGYRSIYSGLDLRGWQTSAEELWQVDDWILRFKGKANHNHAGDVALKTELPEPLTGLVLDFRISEEVGAVFLQLPGADQALEFSSRDSSRFASALEQSGQWNRLEMKVNSPTSQVWMVNGKEMLASDTLTAGEFSIAATGPVEFANIYVRP